MLFVLRRSYIGYYRICMAVLLIISAVLIPFQAGDILDIKEPILESLKSFFVYKLVCQGWNDCYIGETTRHLRTRIKKHLETHKKFQILVHLFNNKNCKAFSTETYFEIIYFTSILFRLRLKESMHVM